MHIFLNKDQIFFLYPSGQILGNAFTTKRAADMLLAEEHRKISDNLLTVQTFDPIIHQLLSRAS